MCSTMSDRFSLLPACGTAYQVSAEREACVVGCHLQAATAAGGPRPQPRSPLAYIQHVMVSLAGHVSRLVRVTSAWTSGASQSRYQQETRQVSHHYQPTHHQQEPHQETHKQQESRHHQQSHHQKEGHHILPGTIITICPVYLTHVELTWQAGGLTYDDVNTINL